VEQGGWWCSVSWVGGGDCCLWVLEWKRGVGVLLGVGWEGILTLGWWLEGNLGVGVGFQWGGQWGLVHEVYWGRVVWGGWFLGGESLGGEILLGGWFLGGDLLVGLLGLVGEGEKEDLTKVTLVVLAGDCAGVGVGESVITG
jgi:hypothetical protein